MEDEISIIKHQIAVLEEVANKYRGKTIDNIIYQLKTVLKEIET